MFFAPIFSRPATAPQMLEILTSVRNWWRWRRCLQSWWWRRIWGIWRWIRYEDTKKSNTLKLTCFLGPSGGGFARDALPLPTKPPFTAHLGNLSFDATEGDIGDFFGDCQVTNVRIVEDKLEMKPKGFGYVEFGSLDGLKKALELSGTQFQGRNIRVSVAEPRTYILQ
jgi:hypothetical protein